MARFYERWGKFVTMAVLALVGGCGAYAQLPSITGLPAVGQANVFLVGTGGVTTNKLVKLDSTGLAVVTLTTADKTFLGIAQATASSGAYSSVIVSSTVASCVFDNGTTIGHFVTISSSTAGDCSDTGVASSGGLSALSAGVTVVGVVQAAVSTGATAPIQLYGAGSQSAASGSGTVTTTGSPASGNLTKFSGGSSITNGDLSGDVTTSGTLASTLAHIPASPLETALAASPYNLTAATCNPSGNAPGGELSIWNNVAGQFNCTPTIDVTRSGNNTSLNFLDPTVGYDNSMFLTLAGGFGASITLEQVNGNEGVTISADPTNGGLITIADPSAVNQIVLTGLTGNGVFNGSVQAMGLDATNSKVTRVANGTASTDAVNVSQLTGGTVTNIATSGPITGGPITTTGTITCATCVVASSPGAGIAHFAGSTQTVTSSAVNLASADVTGALPNANLANPSSSINGLTCTLGGTCGISFQTNGTPNAYQGALNLAAGPGISLLNAAGSVTISSALPICADTSGSGTAQTCTTTPSTSPVFTPAANSCFVYSTTTANSGTGLTLNVNSVGAKSVAKWQGTTTLAAGDVAANESVIACYDGTNYNLLDIGNAPSGGGGITALTQDVTASGSGSQPATVVGINNTLLSGLATGIVKNTTSTGVPSIAVAGIDYAAPLILPGVYNVTSAPYNAKCDGKILSNITTTATSTTATSAGFTAADVGKQISIWSGTAVSLGTATVVTGSKTVTVTSTTGLKNGMMLYGITGLGVGNYVTGVLTTTTFMVQNASTTSGSSTLTANAVQNLTISAATSGSITLSAAATSSITAAAYAVYGTNDQAAIQAADTAAAGAKGGIVQFPAAMCIVSSSFILDNKVSVRGYGAGVSILKWISGSDQTTPIIEGISQSNGAAASCNSTVALAQSNNNITYLEVDGLSATDSTYQVQAKGISLPCNTTSVVDHVYVHDTSATCIATDSGFPTTATNNVITNCGRLNISNSAGSNGIGEGIEGQGANGQSYTIANNTCTNTFNVCYLLENQNTATDAVGGTITGNTCFEGAFSAGTKSGCVSLGGAIGIPVTGNNAYGLGDSLHTWNAFALNSGTLTNPAGVAGNFTGNMATGANIGVLVDYTNAPSGSNLLNTVIASNTILNSVGSGIEILPATTGTAADGLAITGNVIRANGGSGILFLSGGATTNNIVITGNFISGNNTSLSATPYRQCGISFNARNYTGLTVTGNTINDNSTNQKYALCVNTGGAITNGNITGNNFYQNATASFNILGTYAGLFASSNLMRSAPTMAAGAAAGTAPTCTTITGTNSYGTISCTTGTVPTTGTLATITFTDAPPIAPSGCTLQPSNALTAAAVSSVYTTTPSTASWTISVVAALTSATAYAWNYSCQ